MPSQSSGQDKPQCSSMPVDDTLSSTGHAGIIRLMSILLSRLSGSQVALKSHSAYFECGHSLLHILRRSASASLYSSGGSERVSSTPRPSGARKKNLITGCPFQHRLRGALHSRVTCFSLP